MLLLEIAAQGVKGVSPAGGTARLRPGYNVVPFDGAALRHLLEALFEPGPRDADTLRTPGSPGPLRAGVTVAGDDGVTYRVVRDFAGGAQLQRFDPQRRSFAPVATRLPEIERHLVEAAHAPTRARRALLTLSVAELPSRAAVPLPAPAARPILTQVEAEKRLAGLRAELERSRRAERLQYQLDGLQRRLFEVEQSLKEGTRLRDARDAAEAALAAAAPAAAAADRLGDFEAKLAAYAKAVARRDETLARIAAERAALDASEAATPAPPFWQVPLFWAGAVGGVTAVAAGIAGARSTYGLRYLALLDIPAFGSAAWVALRWVSSLEGQHRAGRRRKLLDEHERKVEDVWERDAAEIRAAVAALEVKSVPELREALNRVSDLRTAASDASARLEAYEGRDDTRSAAAARSRVQAEMGEVERALATEAGQYVRDARSLEMEIERVAAEAELRDDAQAASPSAAGGMRDPFRELLESAARELGGTAQAAGIAAQARATQLVQALSGGRVTALGVDDDGNVLAAQGGRESPVSALAPSDRDVAYLALKLALVERALARAKGAVIVEDAFAGWPEAARRVAARILKQLAGPAQIVHATADPSFREVADHVV